MSRTCSRPPSCDARSQWIARPPEPESHFCWLYGIVHNQVQDEIRKALGPTRSLEREISLPDDSVAEVVIGLVRSQTTPSGAAIRREEAALLRRAMAELKPRDYEIITMRVFDDLTFPEIGEDPRPAREHGHPALPPCVAQAPRQIDQARSGRDGGGSRHERLADLVAGDEEPRRRDRHGSSESWTTRAMKTPSRTCWRGPSPSDPDRADEFVALAAGFKNLRGMRDPERLGQYRIRRVLAVGGMGKLYEAEEDELHRIVAVKTIKFGRIADPHLLDRFNRERQTLARLHHTNIVPIYAAGQESELLYFSMPRIHGPSLRAVIKVASTLGIGVFAAAFGLDVRATRRRGVGRGSEGARQPGGHRGSGIPTPGGDRVGERSSGAPQCPARLPPSGRRPDGRRRRGRPSRPPGRSHPPRPEAGEHPGRTPGAPLGARLRPGPFPGGGRGFVGDRGIERSGGPGRTRPSAWAHPCTGPRSKCPRRDAHPMPTRPRRSIIAPTSGGWARHFTSCSPSAARSPRSSRS